MGVGTGRRGAVKRRAVQRMQMARARLGSPSLQRVPLGSRDLLPRQVFGGLILASLGWSIISSLSVYPHSLSYFNELVAGPTGGPKHLIHSNVDWGQDLLFLRNGSTKIRKQSPSSWLILATLIPRLPALSIRLRRCLRWGKGKIRSMRGFRQAGTRSASTSCRDCPTLATKGTVRRRHISSRSLPAFKG